MLSINGEKRQSNNDFSVTSKREGERDEFYTQRVSDGRESETVRRETSRRGKCCCDV